MEKYTVELTELQYLFEKHLFDTILAENYNFEIRHLAHAK